MQTRSQRRRLEAAKTRASPPSSSLPSRLAPEIVDLVIDFLRGDIQSLKSCSLVCKSWYPRCRYHLFRSIRIPGKWVSVFLQSLRSTPSEIITTLEIGGSYWRPTKKIWAGIALNVPAIQSLTLTRVDLRRVSAASLVGLKLKHLAFEYSRGYTLRDFAQIACSFPHLEILKFNECYFSSIPGQTIERLPQTLHKLIVLLERPRSTQILEWVAIHDPLPLIKTLSMKTDASLWRDFATMFGDTLERLTLVQAYGFPIPAGMDARFCL